MTTPHEFASDVLQLLQGQPNASKIRTFPMPHGSVSLQLTTSGSITTADISPTLDVEVHQLLMPSRRDAVEHTRDPTVVAAIFRNVASDAASIADQVSALHTLIRLNRQSRERDRANADEGSG